MDMSHFRNKRAFSNRIGAAPGNNESAGKHKIGKTVYGNKTLKSTLTQFNREKKINSHLKQLSKLGVSFPDEIIRDAMGRPPD
ncbi:MAG: transposase [Hungatella sp.]|jgi:hypothetical protein|nr:transposase [Hungatella sp.]